jgi:hypothetical protein
VVFALGTEALLYSRTFFAEPLAAALVALAALRLPREQGRWLGLIALGGIVLAKPQLVFMAVPLAVAATGRQPRALAQAAASIGAAALILALYNVARFGSPKDFGGGNRDLEGSALAPGELLDATATLLVSPGRGLLIYSAAAALGLVSLIIWNKRSLLTRIALAASAGAFAIAALNPGVGVNWGTRYLVPALPLMCTGLAFAPRTVRRLGVTAGAFAFVATAPSLILDWQQTYRVPVRAGREPSTVYWSIAHGPLVEPWRALSDTPVSDYMAWWMALPAPLRPLGAAVALALFAFGAYLIFRSVRGAVAPQPA